MPLGDVVPSGLSYTEALNSILTTLGSRTTSAVMLPLEESLGHALAANVLSPVALPPWNNSAMDGFAVQRADVVNASIELPAVLRVVGNSAAGTDPSELPTVSQGTAVRIMTGAPLPPGADVVIRVEDTTSRTRNAVEEVEISNSRDAHGHGNVRRKGEDIVSGQTVLEAGTTIRSAHLGLLASVGCAQVYVHQRPRVTIISSGDELVTIENFAQVLDGKRIVSSTSYALPALLRAAGAEVTMMPIVEDSLSSITHAMANALKDNCDLLITTGGVSVGDYDYTREAFTSLGGTQHFWRARIRPGGPVGTGVVSGVPWIGLPGNPVSTLVTGLVFAWPLMRKLAGHQKVHHMPIPVRVMSSFNTPAPLTHFLRVQLHVGTDGQIEATSAGHQGSHIQHSMAFADALLVVPEATNHVDIGELLTVILVPDTPLCNADIPLSPHNSRYNSLHNSHRNQ